MLIPNRPLPIKPYWLNRGLSHVSLGNGLFWTRGRGWSGYAGYTGGPKKTPSKFGLAFGFGTTYGTGTTDRVAGPTISCPAEARSFVVWNNPLDSGGSNAGRIFQGAGETGLAANNESLARTITGPNGATGDVVYTATNATVAGQWDIHAPLSLGWHALGISDNRVSLATPAAYINGASATITQRGTARSGSYSARTYQIEYGNRSSDSLRGFNGFIGANYMFDSYLSAAEHDLLGSNPMALFDVSDKSDFIAAATSNDGSMAVSDSQDVFEAISETTGALAVTDSADTFASVYVNTGSLAVTEAADTFSATETSTIAIHVDYARASVNASLSSISGTGDSAVISLSPRVNTFEGQANPKWLEPSAEVSGLNGIRPTFRFLRYNSTDCIAFGNWPTTRRQYFSLDNGVTWQPFDTQTIVSGSYIEFRHNTAFTQDRVRIGRGRQMSPEQYGDRVATLASTYAFVQPTPTAASFTSSLTTWPAQAYIAADYSSQTDELGNTVAATPLYGFQVNDTTEMPNSGIKATFIINTGIHAAEDQAEFVLWEAIDYLCGSSDPEAVYVRKHFRVLVHGLINAPGRQGGQTRGGFTVGTAGATDANRHFTDADGGGLETVNKPRTAILADIASFTGATTAGLLDMHGTYLDNWSTFKDTGNATETAFHNYLASYSGFTVNDEGDSGSTTTSGWGDSALGLDLSLTLEHGEDNPQSDANITTYGQAIIKAIYATALDGLIANGDVEQMAVTDAQDVFAATGVVHVAGSLSVIEPSDTFASVQGGVVDGAFAATESLDSFTATGYVPVFGQAAANDPVGTFYAAAEGLVQPISIAIGGAITSVVVANGHMDTRAICLRGLMI